jgi:hypothetical protein
MVHNTDIFELKAKLNKLKHKLNNEKVSPSEKQLANKYLNMAIDLVNELPLT